VNVKIAGSMPNAPKNSPIGVRGIDVRLVDADRL
jgi:hypothetical protein